MAEGMGFEPMGPLQARRFSRRVRTEPRQLTATRKWLPEWTLSRREVGVKVLVDGCFLTESALELHRARSCRLRETRRRPRT